MFRGDRVTLGTPNLIIHCDDLGLSPSVNRAAFAAFDQSLITSASVIMVSSSVDEVAKYASEHPDADLGIHLTLTSEWPCSRWKPLSPRSEVPSLVDQDGCLWRSVEDFTLRAKGDEIERELNAQIDAAYALGLRPTHVDNHMFSLFASRHTLQSYVNVARLRNLPFLFAKDASSPLPSVLRNTEFILDAILIASTSWRPENWLWHYLSQLATVKPGVSQLIVHLGYDHPDLESATGRSSPWGSAWRQRDFDVMARPELNQIVRKRNINLISWRDIANFQASS
jgi:predicted glycoside hydrolase/deacetylase ChbG (UPF0249 family)